MIKNIFIPERFGSYFIFPQRIIGLDITKTDIYATQIYIKAHTITIEKILHQPIEWTGGGTFQERSAAALSKIIEQSNTPHILFSSISSAFVTVKTIKLPFINHEKIKMIIGYEIEPLLPFPLNEAIIDFIVTKTNVEDHSSEVFVVAVPKQRIEEHLDIFKQINVMPQLITIDMIALYQLYQRIPEYQQLTAGQSIVLLDIGNYETRMAYLVDGQIKLLRTLPQGIFDQLKNVAKQLNIGLGEAHELLLRFGLQNNSNNAHFDATIHDTMNHFVQQLAFTISSFMQQMGSSGEQLHKIILLGGSDIKGLNDFISRSLAKPCQACKPTEFLHDHQVTILPQQGAIMPNALVSLGTALSSLPEYPLNLLPQEEKKQTSLIIDYQLITVFSLTFLLVLFLWGASYWQIRSLKNEAHASAQQAITELQETFPKSQALKEIEGETSSDMLENAVTTAKDIIAKQEKLVNEFSNTSRMALVDYLIELSTILDVKTLGLKAFKMSLTPEKINFNGSVEHLKDAPQVRQILLQSPLVKDITPPEAFEKGTTFNATIVLKKPRGPL